MVRIKAIGLMSGGLDSILAGKLIAEQDIDVTMLSFTTPFFPCDAVKAKRLHDIANQIGVKLEIIDITPDYVKMLRKPKHGYGKNFNPCIDCKILMLKKAKQYAKKSGAKFIFTGEVVGQRPMSQQSNTLKMIEKEAGLKGRLLRPLSAQLLAETEAEKRGWIDRKRLLNISGRGRNPQFELARKYNITGYQSPAGGCLLTCEGYCAKIEDLLNNKKKADMRDLDLLKLGRHFRLKDNKIIVGRHLKDNNAITGLKKPAELMFEVSGHGSPVTLLLGKKNLPAIKLAAELTARYSDAPSGDVIVSYGTTKLNKKITVSKIKDQEIEKYRI